MISKATTHSAAVSCILKLILAMLMLNTNYLHMGNTLFVCLINCSYISD